MDSASPPRSPSLLIITGSMGSGKTAVMAEASDILTARGISHVAIDLDMLGMAHLPDAMSNDDVMYANLKDIWHNYAPLGADRLLLARAIETYAEVERCRIAVGAKEAIVCRLTASVNTMERRVAGRELGIYREKYLRRVATLNEALQRLRLENFVIDNDNRPLTDVAQELLERSGWL